jgi:hypothetical protein
MSDKLQHFPERDPVPMNVRPEKLREQAEIDAAVAEFRARGGEIKVVGSEANRNPEFIIGCVIRPKKEA